MLKRWSRVLTVAVASALLAGGAAAADEMPQREFPNDWYIGDAEKQTIHAEMEGQAAPQLDLTDWMNGEVTPEDMKGKIIVVDFWATWCGPCIAAIPKKNKIAEDYADDVIVIGVCGSPSGQDKMEAVAQKHGIQYPIAKDASEENAPAWKVMWWPTYAVVDGAGKVRALGLKPDAVSKVIDKLLEEQPEEPVAAAE